MLEATRRGFFVELAAWSIQYNRPPSAVVIDAKRRRAYSAEGKSSIFGIHVNFLSAVKGGFYFHPTNEDLSVGTPVMKKPLGMVLSVYTNSENATKEHNYE
ncbi:MAG TPA: hypothetical protein VGE85_11770 [Terracidiphilus sp.]|jgi:hypothetical protein